MLLLWLVSNASLTTSKQTRTSKHRDLDSPDIEFTINLQHSSKPDSISNEAQSRPTLDEWCNMAHVSPETYTTPPAEYILQYVEVIQRHHKRTPYASNLFSAEDVEWDCNAAGPLNGLENDIEGTSPVHWLSSIDTANPFRSTQKQSIATSNCQFPQLSPGGFLDSVAHGAHLREVYGERLGLSEILDAEEAIFRVTNNPLTSQVASGVLRGFYPRDNGRTHDVTVQPSSIDSLEPRYSCPRADTLRASFTTGVNGSVWQEHLQSALDDGIFPALDEVSGIHPDDREWHVSFDHYFDNLKARQCHSKPLPCNISNRTLCVSQQLADEVYAIGNWEYSYLYRDAPGAVEYASLKFGVWMLELESHLRGFIASEDRVKYRHNVAHDGSISSLLGFLQVSRMEWPGMGSEVVFELYRRSEPSSEGDTPAWVLRVLRGGHPMETSTVLGKLDMVPVDSFFDYIRSMVQSGDWLLRACLGPS